jgi:hypothetical protein
MFIEAARAVADQVRAVKLAFDSGLACVVPSRRQVAFIRGHIYTPEYPSLI